MRKKVHTENINIGNDFSKGPNMKKKAKKKAQDKHSGNNCNIQFMNV